MPTKQLDLTAFRQYFTKTVQSPSLIHCILYSIVHSPPEYFPKNGNLLTSCQFWRVEQPLTLKTTDQSASWTSSARSLKVSLRMTFSTLFSIKSLQARTVATTTNLIGNTEKLYREMDSMGQMDVVNIDFSKAFDTVNHRMLFEKLNQVGISGQMLKWLEIYITGRRQQVKVGSKLSHIINVPSSVVQGSHPGPLLFVLFQDLILP